MRPLKAIRISAHHWNRAGLFGVWATTTVVVFALALLVRLLIAPISIGPFTGGLRSSLAHALPGLAVRFDDAALKWSRDEGRLNLVIFGARVFDENQRIIAQAPEAEIGLAVWPFLRGHAVVHRIALVGVQLTLVHGQDGILRLGVAGEHNQSDVLQRIRDAIAKSGKGPSSLDTFAVHRARLAFLEEETGVFVVAPEANLQIARSTGAPGSPKGSIRANVDAQIEISGKPAHVAAVLNLPAVGDEVTADVSIRGLSVKSLAENTKFFSFLAPFDLTADVTGNFRFAHGTQVRAADFGIGAAGVIDGIGKPVHVRAFKMAGRFDGATGRLLIDDGTLEGGQAQAHLSGKGDLDFDAHGGLNKASLELDMDKLVLNMPGVMGRSVTSARASLRGSYVPSSGIIAIDQGLVYGSQLSAKFAGRVVLADNRSPQIDIDGNIAAISIRDLLRYWPLQAAPGARSWIDTNILAGRIGPVLIHTHMLPGDLDLPVMPENALSLTFPMSDATITYIHGLTPMTQVQGTGALTGDTFKATVDTAIVGPLRVTGGTVVIPNLHLRGTQGIASAHVEGNVADVLALMDQKPLQYPTRFGIRSATSKGTASVDVSVKVPMLRDIRVDDIGIMVKAQTYDLGLALSDRLAISNGSVNFTIDNQSLRALGNVSLAGANLAIDWTEIFNPKGQYSTRVKVNGVLSEAAIEQLGMHPGDYFTGAVGVSGELDGYRGKLARAQLKEDLSATNLNIKLLGYHKPVGTQAQAQVTLRMDQASNVRNADFVLTGQGLAAHGMARFAANGDLQGLEIPTFRSGQGNDFSLSLTRDPAQGLVASLTGRSFDAEEVLRFQQQAQGAPPPPAKTEQPPVPYHINVKVDRAVLREGVVLANFVLNASGVGQRPHTAALAATQSSAAQISGSVSPAADGSHLKFTAGDAGLLLRGLLGSNSLRGGDLQVEALIPNAQPAKGDGPDYEGKLTISDFTLVNQPFLTRLFAAGSFGGLAGLLSGKGVMIEKLEVPFTLHGNVLAVHEGRATGPSLGLTGDGYLDLKTNQIALQGVFTPLFGINGFVSNIPVIGNVLGSKKGEGLLGVTYTASGDADDPKVSANPISILTPGILRRIFQIGAPTTPPAEANSSAPAPAPKPQ
jgi:hypothetical protein